MVTYEIQPGKVNPLQVKDQETQIGKTRFLVASSRLAAGGCMVGRGLALNGGRTPDR